MTALRKRAAKEGWTKRAFAAAQGEGGAALPPPSGPPAPEASPPGDPVALRIEAVVTRHMVPLYEEPEEMARRALGMAARAISEGRGLDAARLVRAARELRDLDSVILPRTYWDDEGDGEPADVDGRREHMRAMVRTIALSLAEKIAAGEPLPEEFANVRDERPEDLE